MTAVDNASQSGRPGLFTVTRSGDTLQDLTVEYSIGGDAVNGSDYERLSGRVVIPAGESSQSIDVMPIDGFTEGADRSVMVTLVPRNQPFAWVVLPDTQYYTEQDFGATEEVFKSQTKWIVSHKDELNIAYVLHEGDVTDDNSAWEWANGRDAMNILDGVVPYVVTAGNHDGMNTSQNLTTLYNQYFPVSKFQALPNFGGVFESNRMENSYHLFSAGGVDWLLLSLEFGPRDSVLDWAGQVLTNYPDRRAILLTHAYVFSDNKLLTRSVNEAPPTAYGRMNTGTDIWEKLMRSCPTMGFAFSGHCLGAGRLVQTGDFGNQVFEMLADYQGEALGGAGYLRIVRFYPDQDRMTVQTYSPCLDDWRTNSDDQFEYTNLGVFTNTVPGYQVDTESAAATLIITNENVDLNPPELSGLSYVGVPPVFSVSFDEPVDAESAQALTNYVFDPEIPICSAVLMPDGKTVSLATTNDLVPGQYYTLTVQHVKDCSRATNEMTEPAVEGFTYAPVLLFDYFDGDGLQDWTVVDQGTISAPSMWREVSGQLMQLSGIYGPNSWATSQRKGTFCYWNDPQALNWSNTTFSVIFHVEDNDGVGVLFRYQNPSNYYKLELDSQANFRKLFKVLDGVETTLATETNGYSIRRDYTLRVETSDDQITVSLNGVVLFGGTITDPSINCGTVALYSWSNRSAFFRNLKVTPLKRWPRITIQNPTNGAALTPDNCTVILNPSDPDGLIKRVDLFLGSLLMTSLTNPPYSYAWSNISAGVYTLTAQVIDDAGPIGYSTPVTVSISVSPPKLIVTTEPMGQSVWEGQAAMFSVRTSGVRPVSYQWLWEGQRIPGATNPYLILDNVHPEDAGDYTVVISNISGKVFSDAAVLSVNQVVPPPANTNPPPSVVFPAIQLAETGVPLVSVAANGVSTCTIEWSSDCLSWSPLLSLTNNGATSYFADQDGSAQSCRFYRAVAQP